MLIKSVIVTVVKARSRHVLSRKSICGELKQRNLGLSRFMSFALHKPTDSYFVIWFFWCEVLVAIIVFQVRQKTEGERRKHDTQPLK